MISGSDHQGDENAPITIPDVTGLDITQTALAYGDAGIPVALFDATLGEGNSKGKQCGNLVGSRSDPKNWYDHVSTDPDVIEGWLKKYGARANGIATSPGEAHCVVIDADHPEHIPEDWWPHLDTAPFCNTRPTETDRGHYWFSCPDSGERFGNPAFDWGELRCAGGGLVLPPTPVGARAWVRTGEIPVIPEVIAGWLREHISTRAVVGGVSSADVETFTAENIRDERPNALRGLVKAVRNWRSKTRNTTRDNMRVAAGESRIGFYPWKRARDEFESAMRDSYQARGEENRFSAYEFSRLEINAVSWANAQTLEFLEAVANRPYGHRHDEDEIDEAKLWERPILKHIYIASLSRQMDPRGVLTVALARAISSIPPYVTIPGIISSRSSLNLHVALVGPSSGGKSSSVAVAKEAVKITPEPDTPTLGSGEGIAKAYAYRDTKANIIVTLTDRLLFCDTEIESVEALAKRSGSPLMSQWRKTFTGERLGFTYSDPKHRIPVLDHKYRFCQILGIQPELAGWLLKGIQKSAGTPQRILWAPVVYPDMPRPEELPSWPGPKTLPKWPGPKPRQPNQGKFPVWVAEVDQPADEKVLQDNELQLPPEIETEIREARHRFHIGEMDDLSGHSMLTMLKVAAGFMWLDGRTDKITDEDCELARIVMAISDRTRKQTRAALDAMTKQADAARGKSEGRRELAKAGVLEDQRRADIDRVIARIVPRLATADEKTMSGGEFRRAMRDVSRELLEEAMAILADEGRIVIAEHEWRGQTGWKYTLIEDD